MSFVKTLSFLFQEEDKIIKYNKILFSICHCQHPLLHSTNQIDKENNLSPSDDWNFISTLSYRASAQHASFPKTSKWIVEICNKKSQSAHYLCIAKCTTSSILANNKMCIVINLLSPWKWLEMMMVLHCILPEYADKQVLEEGMWSFLAREHCQPRIKDLL